MAKRVVSEVKTYVKRTPKKRPGQHSKHPGSRKQYRGQGR